MRKGKCKNCAYYFAYYRQWSYAYTKFSNGYCSKHKIPQPEIKSCNEFESNARKEENRAKTRLEALDAAITSINEIAQI